MKNPPVSFMVDSMDEGKLIIDIPNMLFYQEGLALYVPINIDCSITYIQEMSQEDIEAVEARILEQRSKLVKAKFKFPPGKPS